MNKNSILQRIDYENFLIEGIFRPSENLSKFPQGYLGSSEDYLTRCIKVAYRDFNRTLRKITALPANQKMALDEAAQQGMITALSQLRTLGILSYADFDGWHQQSCTQLSKIYAEHNYPHFYIGQGQKWINMALKYVFTMGSERIGGFENIYPFCHVPIDNILLRYTAKYGFTGFQTAWSRINDYDRYMVYQNQFRERFTIPPLDIELLLWNGQDITAHIKT